uniref:hypothetical protein n=1 Tax=Flavobacterium daejeonense TaxID=350893 RepID=UPI00047D5A64
MLDVYISKKRHILFQLLVLFFSYFGAYAQDTKFIPDIEKIYLHTDRSTYFMGEDLWYKAYVVRATN